MTSWSPETWAPTLMAQSQTSKYHQWLSSSNQRYWLMIMVINVSWWTTTDVRVNTKPEMDEWKVSSKGKIRRFTRGGVRQLRSPASHVVLRGLSHHGSGPHGWNQGTSSPKEWHQSPNRCRHSSWLISMIFSVIFGESLWLAYRYQSVFLAIWYYIGLLLILTFLSLMILSLAIGL